MGIAIVLTLSAVYWFLLLRLLYLFYRHGIPADMIVQVIMTVVITVYLYIFAPLAGLFFDQHHLFGAGFFLLIWNLVLYSLAWSAPKGLPLRKKGQFFASEKWNTGASDGFGSY